MGFGSLWHWIIVLLVVLVLFGRGRISEIMGDFGKGIKSFKQGLNEDERAAAAPQAKIAAPEAPAPMVMARIAANPRTGWMGTGATISPTSAVKTTSVITRGFRSAIQSDGREPNSASGRSPPAAYSRSGSRPPRSRSAPVRPSFAPFAMSRGVLPPQRIRGSSSKAWKGGGLDSVHSRVVAPSPQ